MSRRSQLFIPSRATPWVPRFLFLLGRYPLLCRLHRMFHLRIIHIKLNVFFNAFCRSGVIQARIF